MAYLANRKAAAHIRERPVQPSLVTRADAPRVAVVGAGWAGLAAALRLAEAGLQVRVFESAPRAGGRARTVWLESSHGRLELDNGQHLLVGAYRSTVALMERLGALPTIERSPLALVSEDGLELNAESWPAPLHLLRGLSRSRGLSGLERRAIVRMLAGLALRRWRVRPGETVTALLERWGQPSTLSERLWVPLCIGALNTMPAQACARAFAVVLRDTLGGARSDSDFLRPLAPLGSLLPDPALERLAELKVDVRLRSTVRRLRRDEAGWRVGISSSASTATDSETWDAVLLALPPWSAAPLLDSTGLDAELLRRFEPEPIATVWALWPIAEAPALPRWLMLHDVPSRDAFGQWLFDRGEVGGMRVAGVVISAASRYANRPAEALAQGVAAQMRKLFPQAPEPETRVVTEQRATFRCTPQRPTPAQIHASIGTVPGLWLAGDWLWPDYPATLESAVRSGEAVAADMLTRLGRRSRTAAATDRAASTEAQPVLRRR